MYQYTRQDIYNVRIKVKDNHHWRLDNKTLERLKVFENKEKEERKVEEESTLRKVSTWKQVKDLRDLPNISRNH